jgi:prepilin-type N-terminal cleavage/methylation domain-containing protein
MPTTATVARFPHRRGFTLAEMLLASTVAALTATAGAAVIHAVSTASTATRDLRAMKNAGRTLISRIAGDVQQARAIGDISSDRIVLWQSDVNEDDQINAKEVIIIHWNSSTKQVTREAVQRADDADVGNAIVKDTFLDAAGAATAMDVPEKYSVVIGEAIESFSFSAFPEDGETRIVEVRFIIAADDTSLMFSKSMSPRAPADYLFDTQTRIDPAVAGERVRRRYYSRWTGFHDVTGKAAPTMTLGQ